MNNYHKAIHTLRVNIKSLAAESRFIRQEIKKAKDAEIKDELSVHRVNRVRKEARTTQLALACVKGMSYGDVEKKAYSEPNWKDIRKKAIKHSTSDLWLMPPSALEVEEIDNWIRQAREYYTDKKLSLV